MKSPFRHLTAFALLLLAELPPAAGQVPDQLKYSIPAPFGIAQSGAQFGYSVAMDGGYMVVGAPLDDIGATNSGIVKIFDSTNGGLLFTLTNPSPGENDYFGSSVAISGTRVVVGASGDEAGANDAGSAYVYDLSSATPTVPVTTLNKPGPAQYAAFGGSVAISGMRVVVGAPAEGFEVTAIGSAYVYDLDSPTPTVPVATLNNPSPERYDSFGASVAMSGTRIVVGATGDNTGAIEAGSIYVYDLTSATPTTPVTTLNNPFPAANDSFGRSIAISGALLVVGDAPDDTGAHYAGSTYIYDLSSGTPSVPALALYNPDPAAFDGFGGSVAISGTRIAVGAYGDDSGAINAGIVYAFDLGSPTPTVPVSTLTNPSPAEGDEVGSSVAISGTRVLVGAWLDDAGASDAGSAYLYDLSSGTPTVPVVMLTNPGPAAEDNFGYSMAISGTRIVVGAKQAGTGAVYSGAAYVYDLSSAMPTTPIITLNNPSPALTDNFGNSVAISGMRVVVGAFKDDGDATDSGRTYVYDLNNSDPKTFIRTLNNPGPAAGDTFGSSVAISGTRVVVGAAGGNTGGSAYVYDLSSATPAVSILTLNNPGPAPGEFFGSSMAISGTRIVVGAYRERTGAISAGSAYVYDLSTGTPTVPIATLNNPSPANLDQFGTSVAISGTRVVVGTPYDDTGASDAGSAYVYDLASATPAVPVFTLNNPAPAASEYFGRSVAISGTRLVVGANGGGTGATYAGSVYVYDLSSATPTVPMATLNNPNPAFDDDFGWAVAIDGTTIAIGTPFDDSPQYNKGSAYIFGPSPYSLWKSRS